MLISTVACLVVVVLAAAKWHVLKHRHHILATTGKALRERKSLWIGMLVGFFYLALFMIFGGRGGRIHILFGRIVWNANPGEILAGLVLAALVTISTALFVYGVQLKGLTRSTEKGTLGVFGAMLAVMASFCP